MTIFGLTDYFDNLQKKLKSVPREFVDKVSTEVLNQAIPHKLFQAEGNVSGVVEVAPTGTNISRAGQQWQTLQPSTLRINPRRRGGRILQDTGMLRNSIGVRGAVVKTKSAKIKYGTFLKYAAIHQFGGVVNVFGRVRKPMPARPFVFLTDKNVKKIISVAGSIIDKKL